MKAVAILLLGALRLPPAATAWSASGVATGVRRHGGSRRVRGTARRQTPFEGLEDLEEARRAFERLLDPPPAVPAAASHGASSGSEPSSSPPPLLLSAAARRRRLAELKLLQNLETSDGAVEGLIDLWVREGTPEEARALRTMEAACSPGLRAEEAALARMVRDRPAWCEPCLRLATLLFYQGRTEESFALAHRARALKPWHFEIYPLLIMLSLRGPRPSLAAAVRWARLGLPRRPGSRRRRAWVRAAVAEASARLRAAECATEDVLRPPGIDEAPPRQQQQQRWHMWQ